MTEYITQADVDGLLGTGWAGTGDAARAVLEANAWLTAKGVRASDPIEADIKQAGAYLAQSAAQGALYADSPGSVKSTRVKADTVESETVYQDGSSARSGSLRLVYDLLRPYLPTGGGSTFSVARG